MANWTELKAAVATVIKTNGNQEITGAILQSTLNSIISNVGENATFKGIATPTTAPGTPDGTLFYIATVAGTYTNFGGLTVNKNEIAFLYYTTSWQKMSIPVKMKRSDVVFMTDKTNAAKCFSFSQIGNGSVTIPTSTLYYTLINAVGVNDIRSVSNAGAILTASDGNIQKIILDISTSALSMVPYNSTDDLNNDNKLVVGWYYNAIGLLDINGAVNYPDSITADINSIKATFNLTTIVNSIGALKFTATNNQTGSATTAESVLKVTANNSGCSGIYLGGLKLTNNKTYLIDAEVKKESGDDKQFYIGNPVDYATGAVVFTPTTTWQKVSGKIVGQGFSVTYGVFICAGNELTNEVVQFRNISIRELTYIEANHESRIVSLENGGSGGTFDIQAAVNAQQNVFVPPGTYTLTSTLVIPSGRRIYGVLGQSIIKAGTALTKLITIDGVTDITLENLKILGVGANTPLGGAHNAPAAGVVDTFDAAIAETNAGTKIGVYLNASERINIRNCEISNFDKYGLQSVLCGKLYEYGIKITDNYIHDNYLGLKTNSEAEYSTYTGNSITKNQIGVYCDSGNNNWVNNHIDKNRVGLVMSNGYNNSHGSFGVCSFNHNSLYGICLNLLSAGESFTGCQIWYGNIYVKGSKGIVFSGGEIGASTVYADGNFVDGGMWMICNTIFQAGNSIVHNHNGNTSNLKLKNNWYMDGSDSAALNN